MNIRIHVEGATVVDRLASVIERMHEKYVFPSIEQQKYARTFLVTPPSYADLTSEPDYGNERMVA